MGENVGVIIFKSICEKPPKTAVPGDDTIGACDDPSCCNGHIGVEFGGKVDDSSFSSSSEWKWNSRALAGRLNRPNRLLTANDINAINKAGFQIDAWDSQPINTQRRSENRPIR